MKSADYWAAEMECAGDNVARVEAIREEMRQECLSSLVTAVEKRGSAAVLSEFGDAVRNAGKPKLRKGQLVVWTADGEASIGVIYEPSLWESADGIMSTYDRLLKWSDLCDWEGHEQSAFDGDVFLKAAMK